MTYEEVVDRAVAWAVGEPRIRALWLEGESLAEVRRPYSGARLHVAIDEPEFRDLLPALGAELARGLGAAALRVADTQRLAKEVTLRAGGLDFTVVAEQTCLLAKRPRAELVPLVDKTGHLPHVMDFSRKRKGG